MNVTASNPWIKLPILITKTPQRHGLDFFFFFERYKCYLIMNKLPAKHTINIFLPRYALSKIQLTLVINKKDKL